MSTPDFVVLLRATQNWSDLSSDQFSLVDNPLTANHDYKKAIDEWNACYKLSLQEFRARLTDIARNTWPTTEVVTWSPDWKPDPNVIYLPTDDDDWFYPDVLQKLATNYVALPLFVWRSQTLLFIDNIVRPFFPATQYVNSNAYALHGRNPEFYTQLFNHHRLPSTVHMSQPLSLYLAHPGSLYHRAIAPGTLPFQLPTDMRRPVELDWASSSIIDVLLLLTETTNSLRKD